MPIINNLLGTGECKFVGLAHERNYFELKLVDYTTGPMSTLMSLATMNYSNNDSSIISNDPLTVYYGNTDPGFQFVTVDGTYLNFYIDATASLYASNVFYQGYAFLQQTSGFEVYDDNNNYIPNWQGNGRCFDIRCKIDKLNIPNGYSDYTFAFIYGIGGYLDAQRLVFKIDSPVLNRRRLLIEYAGNYTDGTCWIYSRTESFLGEFGDATVINNIITGNIVRDLRIARAGRNFYFEWNFASDYTNYNNPNFFQKDFKNKIKFNAYDKFGEEDTVGGTFNVFTGNAPVCDFMMGFKIDKSQITNLPAGEDYTALCQVSRLDFLPGILIDSTNDCKIGNIIDYNENTVRFIIDDINEGKYNLQITKGTIPLGVWFYYIQSPPNSFEFIRKDKLTPKTAQFLYNNQLNFAKTGDLKSNLYIDKIEKNENSLSNIYPNITCDKTIGKTDTTYKLIINKEGYIENLFENDSTEFNSLPLTDIYKIKNKLVYGRNNFPTYLFYDGTYNLGRSAKFEFMDNILLVSDTTDNYIRDNIKLCERDSTSYYIIETVSDGTNFSVFTRIFNPYTKTLSPRSLVNSELLITNRSPTFTYQATDYETFNFRRLNPNPDIIVFSNKHICALTVDTNLISAGDIAYRLFYESFDDGTTWIFKNNSVNISKAGERNNEGQSHTFKLKDNDDYLFNINGKSYLGNRVLNFIHRKDNFAFRPQGNIGDLLYYSKLRSQTIRYIKCSYDMIQKNIGICIGSSEGSLEVIKSPIVNKDSVSNLDANMVHNSWRSEYISKPYSDGQLGNINCAYDKNGDLIIIASKANDDTSFTLLRTNFNKDDIDLLGRFMQVSDKSSTRIGRSITNMFSDYHGDIIMSSVSKVADNSCLLNIAKYGLLTNETNELNLDEGFLSPQRPWLLSGTINLDSTINGLVFDPSSAAGINSSGSGVSTVFKGLANSANLKGFKAEWSSFITEPVYSDITSVATRVLLRTYGNQLTSTDLEKHSICVGWDITSVWAYDFDLGTKLGKSLLDPKKFRKYMCVFERTSDNSVAGILFAEDLNLSNYEKIIYKTMFQWVSPFYTDSLTGDTNTFNVSSNEVLHSSYLFISRNNTSRQFNRKNYLGSIGEGILSRSSNDYNKFNGITANEDITSNFSDGIKINWKGYTGIYNDYFTFSLKSATDPSCIFDKEPFKYWRSVTDNTSCIIAFDSTEQSSKIQFVRGDIAIFNNVNFRRCFIEGHTSSLLNSSTIATYSKEIFFDIDGGTVFVSPDSYGSKTILNCPSKNWEPSEHIGRYIQFESCRLDSTPYRHMAFKIEDNGVDSLTFNTGNKVFDTTVGFRYYMFDGNMSVKLIDNTAKLNFWRIRIPPNQINNPANIGDETAQSSVFLDGFREIGEFDIGRLTSFKQNIDEDLDISIETDVKTTEFENLSVVNYEFSKPIKYKTIRYSNGNNELMNEIKRIFIEMYGSGKTLWFFEDQKGDPRNFMLCRIMNEPNFEEANDEIQSISIELEEVV